MYQDSMHPWIKSDHPGKCTICEMDLTPIYEGQPGFGGAENLLTLSSNNVTVLNVQTEEAKPQTMERLVRVAGTLEANETKKTIVAAPAAGRIDELMVRYAGVEVREGERLATFYSPELTLEKRRFLVRARMSVQRDPTGGLAQPVTDSDPYYSDLICPQNGTVVERRVYKGQYVSDGERLFTLVDLSVLWFRFDVYEQQMPWLAVGQTIDVSVPTVPGQVFPAVITFIEPMLNESTRTFKVRADLKNPLVQVNGHKQYLLGLGVYAEGGVRAELPKTLAVPRSAILSPGGQAFAYVALGNGTFQRRAVKLGRQGDSLWEVLQGLDEGERVVTSGNVLLDAQAQFTRPLQPLALPEPAVNPANPAGEPMARPGPMAPAAVLTPDRQNLEAALPPKLSEKSSSMAMASHAVEPHETMPAESGTATPKHPSGRRAPVRSSPQASGPGFRNNRLGPYDAAFDAAFNRMAELRSDELTEATRHKLAETPKLTEAQCRQLQTLVDMADATSQALADDNLPAFLKQFGQLDSVLAPLAKEFGPTHPLGGLVQRLASASKSDPAKDLEQARVQFLTFSAGMVDLAKKLKQADPSFAALKTYHCPMAPAPGLWLQAKGPLRNPFFGAKMLKCGEELAP
jgi:membrane fusion protein, copper/silver efflux system